MTLRTKLHRAVFPPAARLGIVLVSTYSEGLVSIAHSSARRRAIARAHVAIATLLVAPVAAAQVVRGTVVDQTSGRLVPGVVVVLFDSAGHRLAGVLAGDDGRYAIRATGAGRYGLRTERIGFRADAVTSVTLSAGETIELKLITRPVPVVLGEVRVAAKSPCVARARDGREVSAVWEEARKALYATELSQRQELFSARVSRFVRMLDAHTGRVTSYETKEASGVTRNPIVSESAADLSAHGYVRQAGADLMYYGPDAAVLLSDEFLGDHCFRLRAGQGRRSELVGLEFEPVRGRDKPDIAGTLWIDRRSAELRDLEFTYRNLTSLPRTVQSDDFGGQVAFQRMPSGVWIVERWMIRMPVLVDRGRFAEGTEPVPGLASSRADRVQLSAIREEGGEVLETTARGARRELATARGTLRGIVFDSTRMAPLETARVFLDGTQFSTRSIADGSFTLGDVPEGTYTVSVLHPRFDSLGLKAPVQPVTLRAGEPVTVPLAVPSMAALLARICPANEHTPGMAALRGRVVDAVTGGPAVDAEVIVSWNRLVTGSARATPVSEERRMIRTDTDGRYTVCALPDGVRLTVRARHDGRVGPIQQPLLRPDELSLLDLTVAATTVAASAGPTASSDVPRGSGRAATAAEPANPVMADIARRRRMGTGTYMTRAQIARRSASRLTDLLRTISGVAIRPDENGTMIVELRGGPRLALSPSGQPTPAATDSGAPAPPATAQFTARRCPAGIMVDGLPVDVVSVDTDVQPETIEIIEVYSGAQVPMEYASRYSACGVVLIWTRAYADRPGPSTEQGDGHDRGLSTSGTR